MSQNQKPNDLPLELRIVEFRDWLIGMIRQNGLGVTINRMIVGEIYQALEREESVIVGRMRHERDEKEFKEKTQKKAQ